MLNNYTIASLTLRRIDICDLLLACLAAQEKANDGGKKWIELHDEIMAQLDDIDRKGGLK